MNSIFRAVITLDEYSYIVDGRKVTVPKGAHFYEVSRPNSRWVLVSRVTDSLTLFLPSRILAEELPLVDLKDPQINSLPTVNMEVNEVSKVSGNERVSLKDTRSTMPVVVQEQVSPADSRAGESDASQLDGSNHKQISGIENTSVEDYGSTLYSSGVEHLHPENVKPSPTNLSVDESDTLPSDNTISKLLRSSRESWSCTQTKPCRPSPQENASESPTVVTTVHPVNKLTGSIPLPATSSFSRHRKNISLTDRKQAVSFSPAGEKAAPEGGSKTTAHSRQSSISTAEQLTSQSPRVYTAHPMDQDSSASMLSFESDLSQPDEINSKRGLDRTGWHRTFFDGKECYVNPSTNERWTAAVDPRGQTYYYELQSMRSVWSLSDLDPDADFSRNADSVFSADVCIEPAMQSCPPPHSMGVQFRNSDVTITPPGHSRFFLQSMTPSEFVEDRRSEAFSITEDMLVSFRKSKRDNSKQSHPVTQKQSSFYTVDKDQLVGSGSDSSKFSLLDLKEKNPSGPTGSKLTNFERRGVVKWTKLTEKGIRHPERWTDALMILSGPYLTLYKNTKAAASKLPQSQGKYLFKFHVPQLLVAEPSDSETKKQNALKLEVENSAGGNTSILVAFQSMVFDSWKAAIHCAKRLVNEGRVAGVSGHPNTRSANLDNHIIVKLRDFFSRRPTAESLRSRGILKNESVFASSLVQICENESTDVPRFVANVIRAIEAQGLQQRGIYRVSGNAAAVQKLRCCVNQGNYSLDSNKWPLEVLTDSLKLFFRELKEPLFICELFPKISALIDSKLPDCELAERIRSLITSMPLPHVATAKFLFSHLEKVMQLSSTNQMTAGNLATVFGPGLLRADRDSSPWGALAVQVSFVNFCLEHVNTVFRSNPGTKPTASLT